MFVQLAGRPARQESHAPHFGSGSTTTRATDRHVARRPLPTGRTRPTNSWPMMTGGVDGWPGGTLMIWTSEPQTPHASTSIRTSSAAGVGSGNVPDDESTLTFVDRSAHQVGTSVGARSGITRVAPGPGRPGARSSRRRGASGGRRRPPRRRRRRHAAEEPDDGILGIGQRRARGPGSGRRGVAALGREDRGQRVDRRLPRVADADRLDADRPPDRGRVAPDLGAVRIEHGALVGEQSPDRPRRSRCRRRGPRSAASASRRCRR